MALTMPAKGRSHRIERQFGITVGIVFLALGLWWIYRGKMTAIAPWFAGLGALLAALGLIVPRLLVWPNRGWMAMAEGMAFVMTRVVLAIVFFIVVTPIGLVKRLTGWDPLRRRGAPASSYWTAYPARQRDPKHYEKMF